MEKLKSLLKKVPIIVEIIHSYYSLKKNVELFFSHLIFGRKIELIRKLGQFAPNTAGYYYGLEEEIHNLTLLSARQVFPLLSELNKAVGKGDVEVISAEEFCAWMEGEETAQDLKKCFDARGCDKSLSHNYHLVYGPILKKIGKLRAMLEIGLGTTNTDVVSNMGSIWTPGGSLRAFRDFMPDALFYGADIDERILFEEPQIKTFYVDQTEPKTLTTLGEKIPSALELIIDDGLHAPNANIAVLAFALKKLCVGGWVVIEDISEDATPIWKVVSSLLPDTATSYLIRAHGGMVFAVEKTA